MADGTTESFPDDGPEEWSNSTDVFQFIVLENLVYDTENPRLLHAAGIVGTRVGIDPATGRLGTRIFSTVTAGNGSILSFEFEQDDPAKIDHY